MRIGRSSRRGILLVGLVVIAGTMPGGAAAKRPDRDITATARGAAMARSAVTRFAAKGLRYRTSDLQVIDYGTRGVMVVPVGTKVTGPGAVETSGSGEIAGSILAVAAPDANYSRISGACLARHNESGGYMDACWALYKETSDGSSTYDWWGLHFFASMFTPEPHYWVGSGYVQAARSGGPAQTWAYWDPRSEQTGSCHDIDLNLLGGVFGFSHTMCESWSFTKGNPTVTMRTTYNGNADGVREVAETLTVRVAQGSSSPVFGLNWDMTTCHYPNPCP